MGEAITITSGKSGAGKSSACINMGIALTRKGYRVCLIDVDLGLKSLDVTLGLESHIIYDLKDVVKGRCTLANAMIRDRRQDNLYLLPACKTIRTQCFHGEDLKIVVEELENQFDYVLLGTPVGIGSDFIYSIACVNRAIVVTTLDVMTLQDADRTIGTLMKEGMEHISSIVNRVNVHHMDRGISVSLGGAKQWLPINFLGYVSGDESMMRSSSHGKPIVLQRETQTCSYFDSIVRRMLGQRCPLPEYRERKFLQKLFG